VEHTTIIVAYLDDIAWDKETQVNQKMSVWNQGLRSIDIFWELKWQVVVLLVPKEVSFRCINEARILGV